MPVVYVLMEDATDSWGTPMSGEVMLGLFESREDAQIEADRRNCLKLAEQSYTITDCFFEDLGKYYPKAVDSEELQDQLGKDWDLFFDWITKKQEEKHLVQAIKNFFDMPNVEDEDCHRSAMTEAVHRSLREYYESHGESGVNFCWVAERAIKPAMATTT